MLKLLTNLLIICTSNVIMQGDDGENRNEISKPAVGADGLRNLNRLHTIVSIPKNQLTIGENFRVSFQDQ